VSQRLVVDLAHACYVSGNDEEATKLMRQVAAENHEDKNLIAHISSVFEKTGQPDAGKDLLEQVGKEIVELNNKGVIAARSGDLEGAVQLLIQAVEQVPNLQFLVNAAKAIYALMDKKGWDQALAARALDYLQSAQRKDRKSAKVASARELYVTVAKKYGVTTENT
jgi:tetratricopeptide (TPR) repeat protein